MLFAGPYSAAASLGPSLVFLYFTLLLCFFFSVRKDLNLLRTLSQYVNERLSVRSNGIQTAVQNCLL